MVNCANAIRQLVDVHFPKAKKIRLVLDNLNTHTSVSLVSVLGHDCRRVV